MESAKADAVKNPEGDGWVYAARTDWILGCAQKDTLFSGKDVEIYPTFFQRTLSTVVKSLLMPVHWTPCGAIAVLYRPGRCRKWGSLRASFFFLSVRGVGTMVRWELMQTH